MFAQVSLHAHGGTTRVPCRGPVLWSSGAWHSPERGCTNMLTASALLSVSVFPPCSRYKSDKTIWLPQENYLQPSHVSVQGCFTFRSWNNCHLCGKNERTWVQQAANPWAIPSRRWLGSSVVSSSLFNAFARISHNPTTIAHAGQQGNSTLNERKIYR